MKTQLITRLLPCLLLAGVVSLHAEEKKQVIIRKSSKEAGQSADVLTLRRAGETEKVAFLGVETSPVGRTLAAQLGLPRDTGLVVTGVADDSPAAAVLKEHDILTRLDDQILIDSRQLAVLVRSHKEGDEVSLTVYRAGKETKLTAKLAQREMPAAQVFGFATPAMPALPEGMTLPGLGRDEMGNVLRLIGRDNVAFATPRVHVIRGKRAQDSTILDLTKGNFVYSDDAGSVEINADDGKRTLTIKDPSGKVTYQGSIANAEDREKLPAEVRARLGQIEKFDLGTEPGEDFEQGTAVTVPGKAQQTRLFIPRSAPGSL